MKFIFGFLTCIVVIVFVGATLLGFVPVLSPLIAGPKDLGIRITVADSQAAMTKVGTEIIALPSGTASSEDFRLEGKKDANFTMDSKELTANSNNRPWKNYPVRDVQVKILPDGTIEGSAVLIISKAMPYAEALGYSETQIRDAMEKYHIPPFEVPVYVRGKGSVINDSVSVNASNVTIGIIPIPGSIVAKANKEAESVLNDIIRKHSSAFHADSVTFDNGLMTFKGQVPVKEFVIE
jgi:hypothetical protein